MQKLAKMFLCFQIHGICNLLIVYNLTKKIFYYTVPFKIRNQVYMTEKQFKYIPQKFMKLFEIIYCGLIYIEKPL